MVTKNHNRITLSSAKAVIFASSGEYQVPQDSTIVALQVKLWGGGGGGSKDFDR